MRLQGWQSGNQAPGAQKAGVGGCLRALNGPREPILLVRANFASQLQRNSVLSQEPRPLFGCFEALSGLPEPDFNSASVGGTTFEGSDYI